MRQLSEITAALQAYHPQADVGVVQRAYDFSARVHGKQRRKSGEPFLSHPLEVAFVLTRMRLDEASIATGLLHDTVEDTLATLSDLEAAFGGQIARLVDGVTKLSRIDFDTDEHKQAENFRKMLLAMAKDIRVILVKLADRLHNMSTLQHLAPHKQRKIAQETMDIYAPLASRLGIQWVKTELEDLAFAFLYPSEAGQLQQRVEALRGQRGPFVAEVLQQLGERVRPLCPQAQVEVRPKQLWSIHRKMVCGHIEFEGIYDVMAFVVVVASLAQCYEVLGLAHALWHPIPGRFKDYVAMPKANGYQSLHTSVMGPWGERIEVQIRTQQMHAVADGGIAAHWQYQQPAPRGQAQYAWLRQLLEWQQDLKDPGEFLDTVKVDLFVDEVFVFTPSGEVVSLKRGATPVDFAFAIHSQVGMRCAGAKVNGRMVPLRHALKNGDAVEIITSPQARPSRDWLAFVRTGRAKSKIRAIVQAEERARSRELGAELLERELKRYGLSLQQAEADGSLQRVAASGRHQHPDGLLVALGYGRATCAEVLQQLAPGRQPVPPPTSMLGRLFGQVARRSTGGVMVQGVEDVLVRFGRCCNPLPGDPILGFITRGRGITVHVQDCSRAIDADPDRRVDVAWDPAGTTLRPVTVRVMSKDSPGMLATLSQAFTDQHVNISQANCRVTDPTSALNTFEVMIRDAEQLRVVLGRLRTVRGVLAVERA